ncbi:uncharacterized protein LOC141901116 [Tubulanus polymorphus]|uniref:uncharacterized protein LOC141901116 n=1 Tax=Tubulanus polymorphus TaxID=672921 RepID=UPI003DA3B770
MSNRTREVRDIADSIPAGGRDDRGMAESSTHELEDATIIDVDSLKKFTIPKRKKSRKELLEKVGLESRQYLNDVLPLVTQSFHNPITADSAFQFTDAFLIHNDDLTTRYLERRKHMRTAGYSEKEITDSYAFLYTKDLDAAKKLCSEGTSVGNCEFSCLGNPKMAVCLCRHADILKPTALVDGHKACVVIFKIIKGKTKSMTDGSSELEPTPNFDCHISKTTPQTEQMSLKQQFDLSQIYIYEYNEDLDTDEKPRQILPYAILQFQYTSKKEATSKTSKNMKLKSSGSKQPRPGHAVRSNPDSKPIVPDVNYFVVWSGKIRTNSGKYSWDVDLVSYSTGVKPGKIIGDIVMRMKVGSLAAEKRYLDGVTGISKVQETCHYGWYYNYCELREQKGSTSKLSTLVTHLKFANRVIIQKLIDDVDVLLLPDGELTLKLGIPINKKSSLSILHCVFVSKKPRVGSGKYSAGGMYSGWRAGGNNPVSPTAPSTPVLAASSSQISLENQNYWLPESERDLEQSGSPMSMDEAVAAPSSEHYTYYNPSVSLDSIPATQPSRPSAHELLQTISDLVTSHKQTSSEPDSINLDLINKCLEKVRSAVEPGTSSPPATSGQQSDYEDGFVTAATGFERSSLKTEVTLKAFHAEAVIQHKRNTELARHQGYVYYCGYDEFIPLYKPQPTIPAAAAVSRSDPIPIPNQNNFTEKQLKRDPRLSRRRSSSSVEMKSSSPVATGGIDSGKSSSSSSYASSTSSSATTAGSLDSNSKDENLYNMIVLKPSLSVRNLLSSSNSATCQSDDVATATSIMPPPSSSSLDPLTAEDLRIDDDASTPTTIQSSSATPQRWPPVGPRQISYVPTTIPKHRTTTTTAAATSSTTVPKNGLILERQHSGSNNTEQQQQQYHSNNGSKRKLSEDLTEIPQLENSSKVLKSSPATVTKENENQPERARDQLNYSTPVKLPLTAAAPPGENKENIHHMVSMHMLPLQSPNSKRPQTSIMFLTTIAPKYNFFTGDFDWKKSGLEDLYPQFKDHRIHVGSVLHDVKITFENQHKDHSQIGETSSSSDQLLDAVLSAVHPPPASLDAATTEPSEFERCATESVRAVLHNEDLGNHRYRTVSCKIERLPPPIRNRASKSLDLFPGNMLDNFADVLKQQSITSLPMKQSDLLATTTAATAWANLTFCGKWEKAVIHRKDAKELMNRSDTRRVIINRLDSPRKLANNTTVKSSNGENSVEHELKKSVGNRNFVAISKTDETITNTSDNEEINETIRQDSTTKLNTNTEQLAIHATTISSATEVATVTESIPEIATTVESTPEITMTTVSTSEVTMTTVSTSDVAVTTASTSGESAATSSTSVAMATESIPAVAAVTESSSEVATVIVSSTDEVDSEVEIIEPAVDLDSSIEIIYEKISKSEDSENIKSFKKSFPVKIKTEKNKDVKEVPPIGMESDDDIAMAICQSYDNPVEKNKASLLPRNTSTPSKPAPYKIPKSTITVSRKVESDRHTHRYQPYERPKHKDTRIRTPYEEYRDLKHLLEDKEDWMTTEAQLERRKRIQTKSQKVVPGKPRFKAYKFCRSTLRDLVDNPLPDEIVADEILEQKPDDFEDRKKKGKLFDSFVEEESKINMELEDEINKGAAANSADATDELPESSANSVTSDVESVLSIEEVAPLCLFFETKKKRKGEYKLHPIDREFTMIEYFPSTVSILPRVKVEINPDLEDPRPQRRLLGLDVEDDSIVVDISAVNLHAVVVTVDFEKPPQSRVDETAKIAVSPWKPRSKPINYAEPPASPSPHRFYRNLESMLRKVAQDFNAKKSEILTPLVHNGQNNNSLKKNNNFEETTSIHESKLTESERKSDSDQDKCAETGERLKKASTAINLPSDSEQSTKYASDENCLQMDRNPGTEKLVDKNASTIVDLLRNSAKSIGKITEQLDEDLPTVTDNNTEQVAATIDGLIPNTESSNDKQKELSPISRSMKLFKDEIAEIEKENEVLYGDGTQSPKDRTVVSKAAPLKKLNFAKLFNPDDGNQVDETCRAVNEKFDDNVQNIVQTSSKYIPKLTKLVTTSSLISSRSAEENDPIMKAFKDEIMKTKAAVHQIVSDTKNSNNPDDAVGRADSVDSAVINSEVSYIGRSSKSPFKKLLSQEALNFKNLLDNVMQPLSVDTNTAMSKTQQDLYSPSAPTISPEKHVKSSHHKLKLSLDGAGEVGVVRRVQSPDDSFETSWDLLDRDYDNKVKVKLVATNDDRVRTENNEELVANSDVTVTEEEETTLTENDENVEEKVDDSLTEIAENCNLSQLEAAEKELKNQLAQIESVNDETTENDDEDEKVKTKSDEIPIVFKRKRKRCGVHRCSKSVLLKALRQSRKKNTKNKDTNKPETERHSKTVSIATESMNELENSLIEVCKGLNEEEVSVEGEASDSDTNSGRHFPAISAISQTILDERLETKTRQILQEFIVDDDNERKIDERAMISEIIRNQERIDEATERYVKTAAENEQTIEDEVDVVDREHAAMMAEIVSNKQKIESAKRKFLQSYTSSANNFSSVQQNSASSDDALNSGQNIQMNNQFGRGICGAGRGICGAGGINPSAESSLAAPHQRGVPPVSRMAMMHNPWLHSAVSNIQQINANAANTNNNEPVTRIPGLNDEGETNSNMQFWNKLRKTIPGLDMSPIKVVRNKSGGVAFSKEDPGEGGGDGGEKKVMTKKISAAATATTNRFSLSAEVMKNAEKMKQEKKKRELIEKMKELNLPEQAVLVISKLVDEVSDDDEDDDDDDETNEEAEEEMLPKSQTSTPTGRRNVPVKAVIPRVKTTESTEQQQQQQQQQQQLQVETDLADKELNNLNELISKRKCKRHRKNKRRKSRAERKLMKKAKLHESEDIRRTPEISSPPRHHSSDRLQVVVTLGVRVIADAIGRYLEIGLADARYLEIGLADARYLEIGLADFQGLEIDMTDILNLEMVMAEIRYLAHTVDRGVILAVGLCDDPEVGLPKDASRSEVRDRYRSRLNPLGRLDGLNEKKAALTTASTSTSTSASTCTWKEEFDNKKKESQSRNQQQQSPKKSIRLVLKRADKERRPTAAIIPTTLQPRAPAASTAPASAAAAAAVSKSVATTTASVRCSATSSTGNSSSVSRSATSKLPNLSTTAAANAVVTTTSRQQLFAYVFTGGQTDGPLKSSVQEYLKKQGVKTFDPYNVNIISPTKADSHIHVFIHNSQLKHLHQIPNSLKLRQKSDVKFYSFNDVIDLKNHTYTPMFVRGGLVIPDDDILMKCSPSVLEQILKFMKSQQSAGHPWIMKIHSQIVCKLAVAKDQRSSGKVQSDVNRMLSMLTEYRSSGVVELLPKHDCDIHPKPVQEYLPCVLQQQTKHAKIFRHIIVLSGASKKKSIQVVVENLGIEILDPIQFLQKFAHESIAKTTLTTNSSLTTFESDYGMHGRELFEDAAPSQASASLPCEYLLRD